ncbi:MAG: LacI family DNA-binding transcriptional regulator [Aeromonas sobria]|jgi:LacI family transcriptional regulator|uniref:Transcriptional regulator n=1 Tax=Aeromonas sobria TaxID=646 RepID=A0A2N3IMN3_AERSO|nr:LacI family DNA-binding transcriptional regulator [Aeromonas sobria]ELM3615378.1 LacI family DNA-binding transcriptional regulator [Aeromonas sobria]PKQ72037.1 transcriptional regulator [Aeromonas sobria]PKQ81264.1 transcriptional regulator [Aeromonas sobria]HEH9399614.1 LacI family DNA-binding transcriptional regulator [Aeromonas sobria]
MATIRQVAALAKVSTATVSRVINSSAYVEPATQERVEKAMRTLNYRRDMAAVALAKRSGNMLGLLTGNLADPFFAKLARGVEAISRQHGFRLMVCSGSHQSEQEQYGLDFLINQGCEAIVAHTTRLSDEALLRYASHMPALIPINRYLPELANRSVWLDNIAGTRAAVEHLVAQGHRHIAFITCDLPIADRQLRLEGYRQGMSHYHLEIKPNWIISQPFTEEGGEQAAARLLEDCPEVTAVLTFNDVMAAGMMAHLRKCGRQIPEDLSIIGFDDILLARYLYPTLTTLHYPIETMAKRAAELAITRLQQQEPGPGRHEFSPSLVIRESVSPLIKPPILRP